MDPGLLFLAHRIPYPPNKGDKVRSFHLLQHLARRYRVYLGAFIDDPADRAHVPELQRICAETCLVDLHPLAARLRSLATLPSSTPLTQAYYRSKTLAGWVAGVLERGLVNRVVAYSSGVAQYLPADPPPGLRVVIDFVDVDSDKWRQYALKKPWPASWIYRRESRTLLALERQVAARADASVFVSADEAALFGRLAPELAGRVSHYDNGVDLDYFAAPGPYPDPYPRGAEVVVFTGAMDYWANVEAVSWFAREAFPAIRARRPAAWFWVVGARPTAEVRRLEALPGVRVTGTVPDVRPYLAHARVAVAPLRIARGVQNKVLEALAMARPVVATRAAVEGLAPDPDFPVDVADEPGTLAARCLDHLASEPHPARAVRARRYVERHYHWPTNLARFDALLEGAPAATDPLAGSPREVGQTLDA